jgi:hypothetical protein
MDADDKILYKEESFAIIGACMKVHRTLGAGFLRRFTKKHWKKNFTFRKFPLKGK